MGDSLILRPAEDRDREAIVAMVRDVVAEGDAVAFDTDGGLLGYWDDPAGHVFVAERGGRVVGTYVVKPNQPGHGSHVGNAGYLVDRTARGSKVGKAMGEHSLETARRLGFEALQFNYVVATNTAAVEAWKRLGFDLIGRVPGAFRHPRLGRVDVLIFHREL